MEFFSTYSYFFGSLFAFVVVLLIIVFYPSYRKEMIIVGTIVAIIGVISEYWFFRDYWRPQLLLRFGILGGVEDLLFGFSAGASSSIVYHLFFIRKKALKLTEARNWIYLLAILNCLLVFIFLNEISGINSIFASAISLLLTSIFMISIRRDLIMNSLFSGLIFGLVLTLCEGALLIFMPQYLTEYYALNNQFPVLFNVFPLTEFIWGISFGMVFGPIFEFAEGRMYKR